MRLGRTIDRLSKKAPQPPVTWQVRRVQPKTGRILYTLTVEPDGPEGGRGSITEQWFDRDTGECTRTRKR
jgi:hypothetical protein